MGIKHTFQSAQADGGNAGLVRPSNWNANHVIDSEVEIPYVATPGAPSATGVNIFAEKIANRYMLATKAPVGAAVQPVQLWLPRTQVVCWQGIGHNTTTANGLGYGLTFSGASQAARGVSYSYFGYNRRVGTLSAAGAGSACGFRTGSGGLLLGNGTLGGFLVVITFGVSDAATVAGAQQFVGVCGSTGALTDQDPAAMLRCIGVGHNGYDANLQFYANTATTPSKTDLGSNFPKNTLSTDWYELTLYAPPNESEKVYYQLHRKNTGHVATGSATLSGFVAAVTALSPNAFRSNGATALAVGIDVGTVYEERAAA
jgi:hypothetical protein